MIFAWQNIVKFSLLTLYIGYTVAMFAKIRAVLDQWEQHRRIVRERRSRQNLPRPWHLSNAYTDSSFNFFGTYHEAVDELRHRYPGALIVHVDWDDGLEGNNIGCTIFYKVPSR